MEDARPRRGILGRIEHGTAVQIGRTQGHGLGINPRQCCRCRCAGRVAAVTDLPDDTTDPRAYWMTQHGVLQGEAARCEVCGCCFYPL